MSQMVFIFAEVQGAQLLAAVMQQSGHHDKALDTAAAQQGCLLDTKSWCRICIRVKLVKLKLMYQLNN
jgi:hypothetical protein